MSIFIECRDHPFQSYNHPQGTGRASPGSNSQAPFSQTEIKKMIQKAMRLQGDASTQISCRQTGIQLSFILNKVFRDLSFSLSITINLEALTLQITSKPLNCSQSYMAVTSSQRRLFASKLISIFNRLTPHIFNQKTLSLETHTGRIKIDNPYYYQLTPNFANFTSMVNLLIKHFVDTLKHISEPLFSLIEVSNANPKTYLTNLIIRKDSLKLKKIEKFSKMMNIVLNLGSEETMEEESLNKKNVSEVQSLSNLAANFQDTQKQFESILLYCNENESFNSKSPFLDFEYSLTDKETKEVKTRLEIPQITAMLENNERTFVVNHIKLVKNISEQSMRLMALGGFSNIYIAEIEFQPIGSHQQGKEDPVQNYAKIKVKKRPFIIKRQNKAHHSKEGRSRLLHQKTILIKLKSALAIFFPKYYFILNQSEEHTYDLVQEHIYLHSNSFNLEEYFRRFRPSTSQQTIIYFAFMILQGLRYLKDYEIAHLDIKMANIMIGKKLAVKILDFGQSFHPSSKNHKPGVSMPYSAPQNYKPQEHYDHKNDVFSFGVLLHYLLTSRYPFYVYSDKQREEVFKYGSISDRWFFTPEGMAAHGQNSIFPFLMQLIGKCLHPDPKCRPQLEWVSLTLKESLQYFK